MTKGKESKIPRKAARIKIKTHNCAFIFIFFFSRSDRAFNELGQPSRHAQAIRGSAVIRGRDFSRGKPRVLSFPRTRAIERKLGQVERGWEPAEPPNSWMCKWRPQHPSKGISSTASNSSSSKSEGRENQWFRSEWAAKGFKLKWWIQESKALFREALSTGPDPEKIKAM